MRPLRVLSNYNYKKNINNIIFILYNIIFNFKYNYYYYTIISYQTIIQSNYHIHIIIINLLYFTYYVHNH